MLPHMNKEVRVESSDSDTGLMGVVECLGTMPFTGILVWEGSIGQVHVVQTVGTYCGCGDDASIFYPFGVRMLQGFLMRAIFELCWWC